MPSEAVQVDIDADASLGALVTRHPELARSFEQRGLDYCCGGEQSLRAACGEVGLDVSAVVDDLASVAASSQQADWALMDPTELSYHLESTHHHYLWAELPRIEALVDKIVGVHGERHPELAEVAQCFAALRADLEPHLLKEERVLFPMIRDLVAAAATPTAARGAPLSPIAMMLAEHEAVGELLVRLRRVTDGYEVPTDGCATYQACYAALAELEADTHLHIHKENNLLFPMVTQLERGPG